MYTLHSTKLSILKMISSVFIWICSHSSEIVHIYSTCIKLALKIVAYFLSKHDFSPWDHHNDLVYQEIKYHLWQVPIANSQQLHPSNCYPLHQRHSCCVAENNCPPHKYFIHNHCHFHPDSSFLHPNLLLLFWKVYVYSKREAHQELPTVGIGNFVSFAS